MKENKTAYAILGLLSHEDMTGYDIKKRIENTIGFFWSAGFGQIYPALGQLEAEGFVTCSTEIADKRPVRNIYSITSAGMEELRRWLALPVQREDVKYEILLKLIFGRHSAPEKNAFLIEEFRQRNGQNLAMMRQYKAELGSIMDQSEDHRYYYLSVLFGEKVYQAYLDWAEEAIGILSKKETVQ